MTSLPFCLVEMSNIPSTSTVADVDEIIFLLALKKAYTPSALRFQRIATTSSLSKSMSAISLDASTVYVAPEVTVPSTICSPKDDSVILSAKTYLWSALGPTDAWLAIT